MAVVDLEHTLRAIAEQYNLAALYVFGSRALEIASRLPGYVVDHTVAGHPGSDVDIAVLTTGGHVLSARDRV